jgi:hypothetical protein
MKAEDYADLFVVRAGAIVMGEAGACWTPLRRTRTWGALFAEVGIAMPDLLVHPPRVTFTRPSEQKPTIDLKAATYYAHVLRDPGPITIHLPDAWL